MRNTAPDQHERERLLEFMAERELDYHDLARLLKWSPTYIYGYLGGAWSLTDSFRWAFGQTFGFDVAAHIFAPERPAVADPTFSQA